MSTSGFPQYQGGTCPNATSDVGLVHLSQPVSGITPVPFARSASAAAGQSCSVIGYGTHGVGAATTYEQKRVGTSKVQAVGAAVVTVTLGTGLADHGDSGGPLLCGGTIAGTTSCHTDGDYPAHEVEHYARVDAFAPWIQQQLAAWK